MKRGKTMRIGFFALLGSLFIYLLVPFFPFLCPTCVGMKKLDENLYVEKNASPQKARQVLLAYRKAQKRLKLFFPDPVGKPVMIACTTWACYERFGGQKPRHKRAAPKGVAHGYLYIKLSPSGLKPSLATAIMTHELTHTEIHKRLGLIKSYRQLPIWFDEGLAVVVSKDPRYSYSETAYKRLSPQKRKLTPDKLTSRKQWQRAFRQKKPVYLIAAHHVRHWLNSSPHRRKKLLKFFDEIERGTDFKTAFSAP